MRSATYAVMMMLPLAASVPAIAQDTAQDVTGARLADGRCGTVPVKGDLVVLSMYGGKGAPVPYALETDDGGAHAVSVSGSGSGRITLVLASNEATIWDLSAIRDRVAGVMAYGSSPQAVAGLPKSIPVTFQSLARGRGNSSNQGDCYVPYAYEGMYKIQQQADRIKTVTGVHPKRWYGGYSPSGFNVDGGASVAPTVPPASSLRSGVRISTDGLMPGNDGLEQLVRAGALRRFGKQDIDAWAAKGGKLQMAAGPWMRMGDGGHDPLEYIGSSNSGYIVLKSLKALPAGLAGADSVVFVVPEGLNVPAEAGHSTMYRLTGYPGRVPPAGRGVVPIDFRAQTILRSNAEMTSATMYVEWDAAGHVTRDGTRGAPGSNPAGGIGLLPQPNNLPPAPAGIIGGGVSGAGIEPTDGSTVGVQDPDASRDMTPSALIAAILLIGGGAGLVLNRRRTGMPDYPLRVAAAPVEAIPPPPPGMQTPAVEAKAPPEVDEEIRALSAHLQEAIDLSLDDATALALIKFKRVVLSALQAPAYDEDLAIELDAIVERHLPATLDAYLKAAKRITGPRLDLIETNLREGVKRLTERVGEIIEEQSARDAEQVTQRGEFIQARHPHPGNPGGLH